MISIFVTREKGESNYCSKIVLDRSLLNSLISNNLTHNQERERERESEREKWREGGGGGDISYQDIIKLYSSGIAEQIGLSKSWKTRICLSGIT